MSGGAGAKPGTQARRFKRPRRKGKAEPVGDILARVMRKHGLAGPSATAAIRSDLVELLGEERMSRVEIRGLRAGQLTIGVRSAPLKHELESFYARKILDWLKKEKGRAEVRRIRFVHVA